MFYLVCLFFLSLLSFDLLCLCYDSRLLSFCTTGVSLFSFTIQELFIITMKKFFPWLPFYLENV